MALVDLLCHKLLFNFCFLSRESLVDLTHEQRFHVNSRTGSRVAQLNCRRSDHDSLVTLLIADVSSIPFRARSAI